MNEKEGSRRAKEEEEKGEEGEEGEGNGHKEHC